MKKLLLLFSILFSISYSQAQFNIKDKLKSKSAQKADEKTDQAIDKGFDKAGSVFKKKNKDVTEPSTPEDKNSPVKSADTVTPAPTNSAPLKSYQNYDFVPGNKILFEDNFMDDAEGESPAHWKLISGQAVVNKAGGETFVVVTEGNYGRIAPRIKTPTYLGTAFTIEFDYLVRDGQDYGVVVFMRPNTDEEDNSIHFKTQGETSSNFPHGGLVGSYPGDADNFYGKWHHAAIAFKNGQIKCYLDQYRVLVIPDSEFTPVSVSFGGIAEVRIKNVKIADGAGMNMLDKLTTDGKIVTHGITFDVNKSSIKPESMGTLNMLVKLMTDKPDLKFEVGGHTDSDGEDAYNMKLSQQRAEAVKAQLSKMGIDASRLTAKGFGESKPLNDNSTPENKANNRRVEFVKQ